MFMCLSLSPLLSPYLCHFLKKPFPGHPIWKCVLPAPLPPSLTSIYFPHCTHHLTLCSISLTISAFCVTH
jgi:hypothetical protein